MANKHDKVFTYSGLFSIGIIYFILLIILILSFVFAQFAVDLFIGLLCTLTITCGLIALIIYLASRHVASSNQKVKTNLENNKYNTPKRGNF